MTDLDDVRGDLDHLTERVRELELEVAALKRTKAVAETPIVDLPPGPPNWTYRG